MDHKFEKIGAGIQLKKMPAKKTVARISSAALGYPINFLNDRYRWRASRIPKKKRATPLPILYISITLVIHIFG